MKMRTHVLNTNNVRHSIYSVDHASILKVLEDDNLNALIYFTLHIVILFKNV